MRRPDLTIAIPTFNRLGYLKEAINSVFCSVKEAEVSVELLISNNCSTDGTFEYLQSVIEHQSPNIMMKVYNQQKPLKPVHNWDFLLQKANCDYFLILSDDDRVSVEFLREFNLWAIIIMILPSSRSR